MYSVKDILYQSYVKKLGHIPSALSVFPIVRDLYKINTPIVLGKTYGLQAWFYDDTVMKNYRPDRKILVREMFKNSQYNIVYCQQQLGLAAGFAVGYAYKFFNICLISDADFRMKSTIDAIRLAFRYRLPVKFIVDYNKVQLFSNEDVIEKVDMPYSVVENFVLNDTNTELIFYKTVKGRGCRILEEEPKNWHYTILDTEKYNLLINSCY